jgi:hypothetical protein
VKISAHSVFLYFLCLSALFTFIAIGFHGWSYYTAPFDQRPFISGYTQLKPSGVLGHGLGILGSLLIIIGVILYSTRKRMTAFSNWGKISRWLEIHIFLCLLGPVLILYHTTFKIGGIAAITFWSMSSVVASGVIGRFLYVQIPRNLVGIQLSDAELSSEIEALSQRLRTSSTGVTLITAIDAAFAHFKKPASLTGTLNALLELQRIKLQTKRNVRRIVRRSGLSQETAENLQSAATERVTLRQKSILLTEVDQFFHYWHVFHLPFSLIMFLTLVVHVTVVLLLGYRWFH